MKTAKRVLAIIVTVIMLVGTCAVAASAADLQAQINGTQPVVTLYEDTRESITINRDVTINLNGYRLIGEPGKTAINIKGGKVVVTDGQVLSEFVYEDYMDLAKTVFTNSPPAIRITGGELEVDGVRLVGGMVKVPKINEFVPSGSAIQSYNGAKVTLKRSSLYGDYGVNNAVRENPAGGDVIIEDALIAAYTKAIKGGYVIANGSEEIVAKERIVNALKSGITLEPGEQELINNFFDERVIIVSKTADQICLEKGLDLPVVTVTEGKDKATVSAETIDYTWPNNKGTDCSYKLVPEYVILNDGSSVAIGQKVDANKVDELTTKILYRVEYKESVEAKPYIDMFDIDLDWWAKTFDKYYAKACKSYDEFMAEMGDLLYLIDYSGNVEIPGVGLLKDQPEFNELRQALYEIAGAVVYNASPDRRAKHAEDGIDPETGEPYFYAFDEETYFNVFGTAMPQGWEGTLDRVNRLKEDAEDIIAQSFTNTYAWGDLAEWAIDTMYPELYSDQDSIVNTLLAQLEGLQALLNSGNYPAIVNAVGLSDKVGQINSLIQTANDAKTELDKMLLNGDVQATVQYAQDKSGDIKEYVNKGVEVLENYETYIGDPKDYIDGDFVKTYATKGSVKIDTIEDGNLYIKRFGQGTVNYVTDIAEGVAKKIDNRVKFDNTFTVTAIAKQGWEFVCWANIENGSHRIVSTSKTFTMNTSIDREIEAYFYPVDEPVAFFTNTVGDICGISDVTVREGKKVASTDGIATPFLARFTFAGWPAASNGFVDLESADYNNQAYYTGTSAFAVPSAYYGEDGAILTARRTIHSYIITPKYTAGADKTITVIDDTETYTATGKFSDAVTMTSQREGDAYWVNQANNEIVSVTKDLYYVILGEDATVVSKAGACPNDYVTKITQEVSGDKVIFYVARSSKEAFQTTGIVFSLTNSMPTLADDAVGCYKATSQSKALNGVYTPSFEGLGNTTLYVRPYIEYGPGNIVYGDVVRYN